MSTMHLDLKPGEARRLVLPTGEIITMRLQKKSGQQARILMEVPPEIRIEPHGAKPAA